MTNIRECMKIKLKTGEFARVSEVLKEGHDYIVEIFKSDGHVEIDQISYEDIASVFLEIEKPITH